MSRLVPLPTPPRLLLLAACAVAAKAIILLAAAAPEPASAPSTTAANVVTTTDQASLEAAMSSGVPVTFAIDGVIQLTNSLVIARDMTLDATGRSVTLDGRTARRHIIITNQATLRLINLTLANGYIAGADGATNQAGAPALGGSIYVDGGRLELIRCTFAHNRVSGGDGGPATLCSGCFESFTYGAPGLGGAIYVTNGSLRATNCIFRSNSAQGGQGRSAAIYTAPGADALGGAIHTSASVAELSDVIFTNNWVQAGHPWGTRADKGGGKAYGGAFSNTRGTVAITNCIFEANRALGAARIATFDDEAGSAQGGALSQNSGTIFIDRSLFLRNSSTGGGGGSRGGLASYAAIAYGGAMFNQLGSVEIRNSAFILNQANGGPGGESSLWSNFYPGDGFGGAIFNLDRLSLVNCTLAENSANGGTREIYYPARGLANGGGISAPRGKTSLLNVTLASNVVQTGSSTASDRVGSSIATTAASAVSLTNTILFCLPGQTNVSGEVIDGGHNISSDASANFTSPSSRNSADPLLGTLERLGGSTPVLPLKPGSPAIDGGDDIACPPTDQRGVGRPSGRHCDIGAFELTIVEPLRFTTEPSSMTAGQGQTVTFWAAVNSDMAVYQWLFNGSPIPGAANSILILPQVSPFQAGSYTVEVTNASGSVTSTAATLTILPPTPPTILTQPRSVTVAEGSSAELLVRATNLLALAYQWQHSGTNLPGATKPLLSFPSVRISDAGMYQVVVSSEFLSATSSPAIVTVGSTSLPSVVITPAELMVNEGDTTNLVAVPGGEPPFDYQWQFEGIDLPGATNVTLTLDKASVTRAGHYAVKVRNAFGESMSKTAIVTVNPSMVDLNFMPDPIWRSNPIGLQQDGRIILPSQLVLPGGFTFSSLVRLNNDGKADPTFLGHITNTSITRFLVQPDDRILIGYIPSSAGIPEPHLGRLDRNGRFDPSFASNEATPWAPILALQADGKILVGEASPPSLMRLNADGTRDSTFAPPDLAQYNVIGPILPQRDGKILVAQSTNLIRLNPAGDRDVEYRVFFEPHSFASGSTIQSLALQTDGKLLVGGNFLFVNGVVATNLVRLNEDGALDTAFRPDWTGAYPAIYQSVKAVAVNSAGNILVGGAIPGGLLRLNKDGSVDANYQLADPVSTMATLNDGYIVLGIVDDGFPPQERLIRVFDPPSAVRMADWFALGPLTRLAVTTKADETYALEATDSLALPQWTTLQTISGNGTKQVVSDANASVPSRFYRIRAQSDP